MREWADSRNCPLDRSTMWLLQVNVFREHLKSWSTSCRIDKAQFGTLLLLSCSHGAFIWLQVAVKIAAWSTTNISATSTVVRSWYLLWVTSIFILPSFVNDQLFDHPPPKMVKAKREIPQPQQDNESLAKYHVPTQSWKILRNRVILGKCYLSLHYRDMPRRLWQIFLASPLCVKHPAKLSMVDWANSWNCPLVRSAP